MKCRAAQSGPVQTGRAKRVALAVVAALALAAPSVASAGDIMACASHDEAAAFRLRHLQSRLMVAALSCNQQAAYNTFVEHFRTDLVNAGGRITSYFQRSGGGQNALNKHITELANAAGLSRAEDPDGFCGRSWTVFWNLEQDPLILSTVADASVLVSMDQPQTCTVSVAAQGSTMPQK